MPSGPVPSNENGPPETWITPSSGAVDLGPALRTKINRQALFPTRTPPKFRVAGRTASRPVAFGGLAATET
jgi:hypothetical protein